MIGIACLVKRLTDGRGVDVAIEALGRQETFQASRDATRPGAIISSLTSTSFSETNKTAS